MISGSFNQARQPIVGSRLVAPRLGVDDWVDWLVDTGAESTCLHPADGDYIGFPYDELVVALDSEGVGGRRPYYREYAFVVFYESDGSGAYAFDVILAIARPEQPISGAPGFSGVSAAGCSVISCTKTNSPLAHTADTPVFTSK